MSFDVLRMSGCAPRDDKPGTREGANPIATGSPRSARNDKFRPNRAGVRSLALIDQSPAVAGTIRGRAGFHPRPITLRGLK